MIHRRIHSAEFKRDAVQLARTGGNLSYTARELGLNASLLRKWLTTEKEQHDTIFENRTLARQAIFDYIEVFYNRQLRHSTLGYLTSHEFEGQAKEPLNLNYANAGQAQPTEHFRCTHQRLKLALHLCCLA